MKTLGIVFLTILIAEIGDKTQIATMLYATDQSVSRLSIFLAAAAALTVSTAIAVTAGGVLSRYVSPSTLKFAAGAGFVLVGLWTIATARQ